jgi:cytochrome c553
MMHRAKEYAGLSWLAGRKAALKRVFIGLAILAGLAALGCTSGNYPVDIFYEMHYQQSYKSHEPPRMAGVENAVAYYPAPVNSTDDSGARLFEVNCSMCHGADAKGTGPVLAVLESKYGYQPVVSPDLTTRAPAAIEPILTFKTRHLGPNSVMPPFGRLLSAKERRDIAEYIGTLPK